MPLLTEVVGPIPPQYAGLRLTADEYFALEDDGQRYELINGVVVMSPSPSTVHQAVIMEIANQLYNFVSPRKLGQVFVEVDVELCPSSQVGAIVYRPDIVYIHAEKRAKVRKRIRTVVPDLIVEVVSPESRNYDGRTKREDYELCGVQEYWLVDPQQNDLKFWQLESGRYVEMPVTAERYSCQVLPGMVLELERIRSCFEE